MHFNLDQAPLSLTDGAVLNINDGEGRTLRVLAGRVWITQEGSLDDVFLNAGEIHTFDRPGSSIVTAEGGRHATATVLFDVPLSVHARENIGARWLQQLLRTARPASTPA